MGEIKGCEDGPINKCTCGGEVIDTKKLINDEFYINWGKKCLQCGAEAEDLVHER